MSPPPKVLKTSTPGASEGRVAAPSRPQRKASTGVGVRPAVRKGDVDSWPALKAGGDRSWTCGDLLRQEGTGERSLPTAASSSHTRRCRCPTPGCRPRMLWARADRPPAGRTGMATRQTLEGVRASYSVTSENEVYGGHSPSLCCHHRERDRWMLLGTRCLCGERPPHRVVHTGPLEQR